MGQEINFITQLSKNEKGFEEKSFGKKRKIYVLPNNLKGFFDGERNMGMVVFHIIHASGNQSYQIL